MEESRSVSLINRTTIEQLKIAPVGIGWCEKKRNDGGEVGVTRRNNGAAKVETTSRIDGQPKGVTSDPTVSLFFFFLNSTAMKGSAVGFYDPVSANNASSMLVYQRKGQVDTYYDCICSQGQ